MNAFWQMENVCLIICQDRPMNATYPLNRVLYWLKNKRKPFAYFAFITNHAKQNEAIFAAVAAPRARVCVCCWHFVPSHDRYIMCFARSWARRQGRSKVIKFLHITIGFFNAKIDWPLICIGEARQSKPIEWWRYGGINFVDKIFTALSGFDGLSLLVLFKRSSLQSNLRKIRYSFK